MTKHVEQRAIQQAAQTLRDLAILGLSRWLDIATSQDMVPSMDARRELLLFFTTAEDLTLMQRRGFARLSTRFVMNDVPEMSATQQQWMTGCLRPRLIRDLPARCRDRWNARKANRRDQGPPVAPLLRDAITQTAWTAPVFRRDVLTVLRSHVRQRVIMHPEGPPPPALAAQTLWAATAHTAMCLDTRSSDKVTARLTDRLMAIAAKGLRDTGWAGFWDGYVLSRPPARDVIKGLEFPINLLNDVAAPDEYRPNWRDESPEYAAQLLGETI